MITNQQTIADKFKSFQEDDDFFGVKRGVLICFMKHEFAKEFLKEEFKNQNPDEFNQDIKKVTKENVFQAILDYLPFAWEKADDKRGISVSRSIAHFKALLWLLDDGGLEAMEAESYESYGVPKLIYISDLVGFDYDNR